MRFIILYRIIVRTTYSVACDISRVHAPAVCSRKNTATTDVRVLLEATVTQVPMGAAAPAGCSCARDCLATPCSYLSLVLVEPEQSSDLGAVSVFCGAVGQAWKPAHARALECCSSRYAAVQQRRQQACECCSNGVCL